MDIRKNIGFKLVWVLILLFFQCQQKVKDPKEVILNQLFKNYYDFKETNQFLSDSFATEGLNVAIGLNDLNYLAKAKSIKVASLIQLKNLSEASNLNNEFIDLCTKNKLTKYLNLGIYNKAVIYLKTDKLDSAINIFMNVLPDLIKDSAYIKVVNATENIGWANYYMKNYSLAKLYIKDAIKLSEKYNTKSELGSLYEKIGIVYAEDGLFDSSELSFNISEKEFKKLNNQIDLALHYNNVGGLFTYKENYPKALVYFNKAILVYESLKLYKEISDIYTNLSTIEYRLGNYKKALSYLDFAANKIKSLDESNKDYSFLKHYGDIYYKMGDFKQSAKCYNDYNSSFYISYEENKKNLEELNIKYQTAKKQSIIKELEVKLIKNKKMWNKVLFVFFIFLTLGAALYLIYKQNSKNRKVISELKTNQIILNKVKDAEENERQRISKNLHDNMGAYASAIIAGVENLQLQNVLETNTTLLNIKTNANNVLLNLRETITILNNYDTNLLEVFDLFKSYALKLLHNYENLEIDFKDKIVENKKINSLQAIHLQSFFKEVLNNAIKHSNCSLIIYCFEELMDTYEITITDNGIGFVEAEITYGEGLKNLQWRTEKLNGILVINAKPNFGTTITLSLVK